MKKLMTLMLGLSLFVGATAVFADATDTTKKTEKKTKAKKTKAKKTDTTK